MFRILPLHTKLPSWCSLCASCRMKEHWCLICLINNLGSEKDTTVRCQSDRLRNFMTIWPSHCRTWHASANFADSNSQAQRQDASKKLAASTGATAATHGKSPGIAAFFGKHAGGEATGTSSPSSSTQPSTKEPRRDVGRSMAKHDALRDLMAPVFAELQLSYRSVEKPKFRAFITGVSGGRYADAVRGACDLVAADCNLPP